MNWHTFKKIIADILMTFKIVTASKYLDVSTFKIFTLNVQFLLILKNKEYFKKN